MSMATRALLTPKRLKGFVDKNALTYPTPLLDTFMSTPDETDSDLIKQLVGENEDRPAPFNRRNTTARVLDTKGMKERKGAIFHVFNELPLSNELISALTAPDSDAIDRKSAIEIKRQLGGFTKQHVIQKEVVLSNILFNGKVYADNEGRILESSDTAAETYDFGLIANQTGDLSGSGVTAVTITSSSADIEGMLRKIDDKNIANGVPPIAIVIAHTSILDNIKATDQYQELEQAPAETLDLTTGVRTVEMFGKTWKFLNHTYRSTAGTTKSVVPLDKLLLVPLASPSWLLPLNGLERVPRSIEIATSIDEALANVDEVYGQFAYAAMSLNPLKLSMFTGDNYGWLVRQPEAIWSPTVKSL